jgi:hypothetical protein
LLTPHDELDYHEGQKRLAKYYGLQSLIAAAAAAIVSSSSRT